MISVTDVSFSYSLLLLSFKHYKHSNTMVVLVDTTYLSIRSYYFVSNSGAGLVYVFMKIRA